jgi:5-methylcytosine-specific restriction endonuclease McrA
MIDTIPGLTIEQFMAAFPPLDLTKGRCCYCEVKLRRDTKTREHVVPRSRGGIETLPCCKACNNSRGKMALQEWGETRFVQQHPFGSVILRNIAKIRLRYPGA